MAFKTATLKLTAALLVLLFSTLSIQAAKFFRFTDENGKMVVSSTLPPDMSQKGYEIVNDRGVVLEVVAPRKTEAQLRQEAIDRVKLEEEARMRREQEQLDAILINSYSDIADIERARDNEIISKDRDVMLLRQNIRRLTRLLEDTQTRAARDERLGKELSPKLMKEVKGYRKRIDSEAAEVVIIEENKMHIKERYNSSIIRFSELKAAELLKRHTTESKDVTKQAKIIYECNSLKLCDKAWNASLRYASEYSTTELAWANETTIMMRKPRNNKDISLVMTRVNNSGGKTANLVLEVRCNKTQEGEALCKSEKVKAIEKGYKPYLK